MKKDLKIKLNQLSKAELNEKEMNRLLGGDNCCLCGCSGPSSSCDNLTANHDGGESGLYSPGGGNYWSGDFYGNQNG